MKLSRSATVSDFFAKLISDFDYDEKTKAYILSIFDKYTTSSSDLSKNSLTLLFFDAQNTNDFIKYQNIGDWVLYAKSILPASLSDASADYYITIGRVSYLSCYHIMNERWSYTKTFRMILSISQIILVVVLRLAK